MQIECGPLHDDVSKAGQEGGVAEGRLAELSMPLIVCPLAPEDAFLVGNPFVDVLHPPIPGRVSLLPYVDPKGQK